MNIIWSDLKRRAYRWGPVVACMAVLFYLSAQPELPDVPGFGPIDWGDKAQHVIAYAVLGALIWRALSCAGPRWWQIGATIALATAYGLSDESHQIFVRGREFDMIDLSADALGSVIAAVALTAWIGGDRIGEKAQEEGRGRAGAGESLRSQGQETRDTGGDDQRGGGGRDESPTSSPGGGQGRSAP